MGVRQWFREKMLGDDASGEDIPPNSALLSTFLGREEERVHSLGDYRADSYPSDLKELLARRSEVAQELLALEVTDPAKRVGSIPRLRELLRTYPHPLVYETLILAYVDSGRYDEAKGAAFAARQRRTECARSEHPEIRAEIENLREWTAEVIDDLRIEGRSLSARNEKGT
jgi:hypothetical protein